MFLPALHSGMNPVAVLLTDVLSGDVVRVVRWLCRVVLPGDDERCLNDAILDRLGQRIVTHCPREVHTALVFGSGGEVEPERQPVWQGLVYAEQ